MNSRVDSLDYLRGMMAVTVMLYHYSTWAGVDVHPDSLLGKLGIYAVSIFYILSGLSLGIVYLKTKKVFYISEFLAKRAYRIFPLFWLCATLTLVFKVFNSYLSGSTFNVNIYTIFINYTFLFGFIDPSNYISIASWSIGNELVFYSFFPVFALSYLYVNKNIAWFWLFFSFLFYFYFSFYAFDEQSALKNNWASYVNPLNQIFLFLSGVVLSCFTVQSSSDKFKKGVIFVMLSGLIIFLFEYYPVSLIDTSLVIGWNRLFLSFCVIGFVYIVYKFGFVLPRILHVPLKNLGDCCYSIYLLHPVVSFPVVFLLSKLGFSLIASYSVSFCLTLFCGYVSYNFFERPIVEMGNERIRLRRGMP